MSVAFNDSVSYSYSICKRREKWNWFVRVTCSVVRNRDEDVDIVHNNLRLTRLVLHFQKNTIKPRESQSFKAGEKSSE